MDFHERRSRNPEFAQDRRKLHAATAETFKELLEAIDKAPVLATMSADPLTLSPMTSQVFRRNFLHN